MIELNDELTEQTAQTSPPPCDPLPGVKATFNYPANRRSFFAVKYLRRLLTEAYANRIGSEACWLLAAVVDKEDQTGFKRPVDFFNGQLMDKCGFPDDRALITARRRCVDAGLLHYEASTKRKAGLYWVMVPPHWEPFDGAWDAQADIDLQKRQSIRRESDNQSVGKVSIETQSKCQPSIPIPVPVPDSNPTTTSPGPVVVDEVLKLEERIKALGVTRFQGVIHAALQKGSSLSQITAVIDHWEQHPGFWAAGAIRYRLTIPEAPTLASDQGWPKADPTAVSRQRSLRVVSRDRQQQTAEAQSSAEKRVREDQLLLQFNDRLSAMTPDEIQRLVEADQNLRLSLKCFGAASRDFKVRLARHLAQVAEPPR